MKQVDIAPAECDVSDDEENKDTEEIKDDLSEAVDYKDMFKKIFKKVSSVDKVTLFLKVINFIESNFGQF